MINKLHTKTVKVPHLDQEDTDSMFSLYHSYYVNVDKKRFIEDLHSKSSVIMIREKNNNNIMGFSTYKDMEFDIDQRHIHGVFSGDTVMHKKYWGNRALHIEFIRQLFLKKLSHPLEPLYWFLISKGYKTYLLMSNNFPNHYPNVDKPIPEFEKKIIDTYALKLYPNNYDCKTGTVAFNESHDAVREGVADIHPELEKTNRRVKFFKEIDPNYHKGTELVCLAEFNAHLMLYQLFKYMYRSLVKPKHL